jgi:hypothetical protein
MAWAVSALAASRQQQVAMAMTDVAAAHRLLADDPFVRRTAGELMAWFDTIEDKSQIPPAVRKDVADLKASLANDSVFAEAYAQARNYYAQASIAAAPAAGSAQAAVPQPQAAPVPDSGALASGTYVNGYVSPAPAVTYDYYAQPYVAGPAYYPNYDTGVYVYAAPVIVAPGFGGFFHGGFGHGGEFHGGFHGEFHGGGGFHGEFHGGGGHHR